MIQTLLSFCKWVVLTCDTASYIAWALSGVTGLTAWPTHSMITAFFQALQIGVFSKYVTGILVLTQQYW